MLFKTFIPPKPPLVDGGTDFYGDNCQVQHCSDVPCIQVDSSTCRRCAKGRYASDVKCPNCPSGKYRDNNQGSSHTQCYSCPAGYYQIQTGASTCLACTKGRYKSSTGSFTGCPACSSGQYSETNAADECSLCTTGQSTQGQEGRSVCSVCNRGEFAADTGQSKCTTCEIGKYAGSEGLANCTTCPGGWISSTKADKCEVCPPGKYVAIGKDACNFCGPGLFSKQQGGVNASVCQACGEFSHPSILRDSCESCEAGLYSGFSEPGRDIKSIESHSSCWSNPQDFSTSLYPGVVVGFLNFTNRLLVQRLDQYEGQHAGITVVTSLSSVIPGSTCRLKTIGKSNFQVQHLVSTQSQYSSIHSNVHVLWPGASLGRNDDAVSSWFTVKNTITENYVLGLIFGPSATEEARIELDSMCLSCFYPEKILSATSDTCEGACVVQDVTEKDKISLIDKIQLEHTVESKNDDSSSGGEFIQFKMDFSGGSGGRGGEKMYVAPDGTKVSASHPIYVNNGYYFMQYMFDGSESMGQHTRYSLWHRGNVDLTVEFPSPRRISSIRVKPYGRNGCRNDIQMYVSRPVEESSSSKPCANGCRGKTADKPGKDCADVLSSGNTQSGFYYVNGYEAITPPMYVFCDMEYDGGGWTLIADKYGGLCSSADLGTAPDPRLSVYNEGISCERTLQRCTLLKKPQ